MEKTHTADELYEYRKMLVDWKWIGPQKVLWALRQINTGEMDKEAVIQSKLYKSVRSVRTAMLKTKKEELGNTYNSDQLHSIKLKLKSLNNQIKEIITKPRPKPPVVRENLIFSAAKFQQKPNKTSNYYDDCITEEKRQQVRQKLCQFLLKLKDVLGNKDYFDSEDFHYTDRVTQLVEQFEKTIYNKYYGQQGADKTYYNDLKTLQQYLHKDHSGKVLMKIFDGLLPIYQACQLQIKDWIEADVIRQLENRNKVELDDANFYRQIRINEMIQAKGQECPKCHNNYLYCIDEKQIRRADEPATLFYECFACSHKYKV